MLASLVMLPSPVLARSAPSPTVKESAKAPGALLGPWPTMSHQQTAPRSATSRAVRSAAVRTTSPTLRPARTATELPSTTVPPASIAADASPSEGVWLELRECESSDNYQTDTGNGFFGAYQFVQSTWTSLGYPGRPDLEPPWMQDEAAEKDQAVSGWGQWPTCSAELGL